MDEKEYVVFLRENRERIDDTLWKYFSGGYFHDGDIQKVEFNLFTQSLLMEITCPNVQIVKSEIEFINVEYLCEFSGVSSFNVEHYGTFSHKDRTVFLGSRISLDTNSDDEDVCLWIEALRGDCDVSIKICFDCCDVSPRESLVFEMLRINGAILEPGALALE